MTVKTSPPISFRISLTNVEGLGATILAQSLLPSLDKLDSMPIDCIYIPQGKTGAVFADCISAPAEIYVRILPKPISRFLECTLLAGHFDGPSLLLVMGDLPVATRSRQVVFIQSPHVVRHSETNSKLDAIRYRVARWIFQRNISRVSAFIVQSEAMRRDLLNTYDVPPARVTVVQQPPPAWLIESDLHRKSAVRSVGDRLQLFYPAAAYPHKNHTLLASAFSLPDWEALVAQFVLTVQPTPIWNNVRWVRAVGLLSREEVVATYRDCDALVFLSKAESYGFPLVEAMWIGLPIVCPDLPYARTLCGDEAIYFDADDIMSLLVALQRLQVNLDAGWWPDWTKQLSDLPKTWADVARLIGQIIEAADA